MGVESSLNPLREETKSFEINELSLLDSWIFVGLGNTTRKSGRLIYCRSILDGIERTTNSALCWMSEFKHVTMENREIYFPTSPAFGKIVMY